MAYIVKGGRGGGATYINPSISLSGLRLYIDPVNRKSYTSDDLKVFNLIDSNDQFTPLTQTVSAESNNKFKYFNFNQTRNLLGSYISSLSTCSLQIWVKRKPLNESETVSTYLTLKSNNQIRPPGVRISNVWVHNFTFESPLTSISFNNFLNNVSLYPGSEIIDDKLKLLDENYDTTRNIAYIPLELQDERSNNMDWEIYYEFSMGRFTDSLSGLNYGLTVGLTNVISDIGYSPFSDISTDVNGFNTNYITLTAGVGGVGLVAANDVYVNPGTLWKTYISEPYNPSFPLGSIVSGTDKIIYNWLKYDKDLSQLEIYINDTNVKPSLPAITLPSFDPFAYIQPTLPPYLYDIIVSKESSLSAYGLYYNKFGYIGYSLGEEDITTRLRGISGEWELITLNFEPDRVRVFKDLTFFETEKLLDLFKTNNLTIGNFNNIDVGQILFYDRYLSDSELVNNYKNFVHRYNRSYTNKGQLIDFLPIDPDTSDYCNRANITDYKIINLIDEFIVGLKELDLFDKINCWPLIQGQNTYSGTTLKSFGKAFDNVDASIVGTFTSTNSGITLDSFSYINTNSPGISSNEDRTIMMITNNSNNTGYYGGWGDIGDNNSEVPGTSWSIKKPTGNTVFQEFFSYHLNSIQTDRGVGVSYGDGKGITWSTGDLSVESVNTGSVNTSIGNFYINRGYENIGEKNNETYSMVLKARYKFTANDFYNVYTLFKNTLGKKLNLPTPVEIIDFDPDTILFFDRVDEPKAYFYKKAVNDFIKFLKLNDVWDGVVCFPLGYNVNRSSGKLQSFGNYTLNYNYEGEIVGSIGIIAEHGVVLTSSAYLSTNLPSVTGSDDRYVMLITNGSTSPGFIFGEGTNQINRCYNIKRQAFNNTILDCWFNNTNQFPTTKALTVDLKDSKYQILMLPEINSYYGNIQGLDVAEGNVVLNAGNVNYSIERSWDTYYFLLKAKKSLNFDTNKSVSIYNKYKTTIGALNNQVLLPLGEEEYIQEVVSFCHLSGNYIDYFNYNNLKEFIIELQNANNDPSSDLYNIDLYNNMVCWPLRQGQTAGGVFNNNRIVSETVYSFGGLPQASAYRVGPILEDFEGVFSSSSTSAASGRIITSTRRLTGYSERTFYTASKISGYNFNRRARMMYTSFAEPEFAQYAGTDSNGMILEGRGFGSQIANLPSSEYIGNIAVAKPSTIPSTNIFYTFSSIYKDSSISHLRNNIVLNTGDESQFNTLPNTPGWAANLTDKFELTIMNSESEPLPFGGSIIGTIAFAADFNIGLTVSQLSAFDAIYKSTLGKGIIFQ